MLGRTIVGVDLNDRDETGRTIVGVDLNVCAKQGKASTSGALPSDIAPISLMVMSGYLDIIEPVESGIHDDILLTRQPSAIAIVLV